MQQLLLVIITICLLFAAPNVTAQLEIGPSGTVGIGEVSPPTRHQLLVLKEGSSSGDNLNFAIEGVIVNSTANSSIGVKGLSKNATHQNRAVVGETTSNNANAVSYAIQGITSGLGTKYAGWFVGNVHVSGTITNPSDARFKAGEQALAEDGGVLERLMRLEPQRYTFTNSEETQAIGLPEGEHYGIVAQELEEVFPELVKEEVHPGAIDEAGNLIGEPIRYKAVNYIEMVPILLQAIQEQQARIEALETELGRP